ncbi:drebrin-like a isoform 2-T2 [Aulostomus maculatus]
MAVNLSKNGAELMAAYKEVVDCKAATDWALFTYEGNSNDIRLAEKGGGGLEEMVEELNSGKVMYAFCRVQDPNSGLPKYVLINWTGEGVQNSRKGLCANHVSSMANFLKGAHVTINARGEDDVEPDVILAKVARASGGNFNFNKQEPQHRGAPRGPVGSVYQKVNAVEEIQQTRKEDFWIRAQMDEEARLQEERRRVELQRQTLEREREEMEDTQAKERERRARERAVQIELERKHQEQREEEEREREQQRLNQQMDSAAPAPTPNGSVYRKVNALEEIQQVRDDFWAQAQMDEEARLQEERRRVELQRQTLEREREEMEDTQAKERERRARERAVQIELERKHQEQREEEEREREQQRLEEQENKRTGIMSAASVQKANEAKSLISQRSFNPRDIFKQREQSVEAGQRPAASRTGKLQSPFLSQKSFEREEPSSPPAVRAPPSNVSSEPEPALVLYRPHAVPETCVSPDRAAEEEEWSDEFDDTFEATPEETPAQEDLYEAPLSAGADEDLYENVYQEAPTVGGDSEISGGRGLSARAVYDYLAADDTEITFDPNDIITGIEMVDEGWWTGYGPDGRHGMFPANYVELL